MGSCFRKSQIKEMEQEDKESVKVIMKGRVNVAPPFCYARYFIPIPSASQ